MLKYLWVILLLVVFNYALADEIQLSVCQYPNGVYQFSFTGDVDSWSFEGAETYDLQALIATGYGVKFTIYHDGINESVYGYPDVPPCPKADEWHPGAPSILIPADPGVYKLEIQDAYGHWSLVTDAAHPGGILLSPNGGNIELIGSVGQDTNPDHYRLIEVAP